MQTSGLLMLFYFISITATSFAQTPELILQKGHVDKINAIAYSTNSKYILTAGEDKIGKIWEPVSGKLITELAGSDHPLAFAYFSPDNSYVVTGTRSYVDKDFGIYKSFYWWNPLTGKLLFSRKINCTNYAYSSEDLVSFSPHGDYFATPPVNQQMLNIYNAKTGALYKALHEVINGGDDKVYADVLALNLISDTTVLISNWQPGKNGKYNITFHVYNFIKEESMASFADTAQEMLGFAINMGHTGRYFLSSGNSQNRNGIGSKYIKCWDLQLQKKIWERNFLSDKFIFSPDDLSIICADSLITIADGTTLFNRQNSKQYFSLVGKSTVVCYSYSPRSTYIASATGYLDYDQHLEYKRIPDYHIYIRNKENKVVSQCKPVYNVTGLLFSPDEQYLIAAYKNGNFSVWDITQPVALELASSENILDPVTSVHISPYNKRIHFLSRSVYGIYSEGSVNKMAFIETGNSTETWDDPLHFLDKDRYTLMSGYRLRIIDNDSVTVLKEFPYNYAIGGDGFNGFHYNGKFISQKDLQGSIAIEYDSIHMPVNKKGVDSFSIFTKPLAHNDFSEVLPENKELGQNPNDPGVFVMTFGAIYSRQGRFSSPIVAATAFDNTAYHSVPPVFNSMRNGYVYALRDKVYFIDGKTFAVKRIMKEANIAWPLISSDGKFILTKRFNKSDKFLYCLNLDNSIVFKIAAKTIAGNLGNLKKAVFSPDGKKLCILSTANNVVKVLDAKTGNPLHALSGHSAEVSGVEYSPDSKFVYTWSADGTCKKWELSEGRLIYTFLLFTDHDYAVVLPDGYYFISSRTDTRYLNFKLGSRFYNFSQFDLQFNRPDKVFQAMGSKDKGLMEEYHRAWLNRIQKAGFKEADFDNKLLQVPSVNLSANNIPAVTKQKELTISFSLTDSLFNLTSYNVFINDVPFKGINGAMLKNADHHVEITEQLHLSEGDNKIEINCTNEKGVESRKETLYIKYQGDANTKHKTYFIGIGINQYSAHSSFVDLSYCVKDIFDLGTAFKDKFKEELVIDTLMNGNANKENILALKQKLMQTDVDDKVIISFSGHGMVDPLHPGDFYFVTGTTDVNNPAANGISYAQLEELLDSIPARKKLMLLDACHSGESVGNDGSVSSHIPGTKRGEKDDRKDKAGSIEILDVVENSDPTHASSTDIFKLMKEAFVDIRRNNGAYVLSAAQSNESAGEGGGISNGWFSSCLIEQLKGNSSMTVNGLSKKVNACVSDKSGGNQNTDNRQELAEFNWELW